MLHLHAGPPLEDQGGPRTRVRVPRDGGLRACVVSGGAGEDFARRGRGEQFGPQGVGCEVDAVVYLQPVRAGVPWRREVRARLGVLENVPGSTGGQLGSEERDD